VTYIPRRGDFGAHYAIDLIPVVEATNCSLVCGHAGTEADRDEFGPGGICHVLAILAIGDVPVEELTRVEDRIDCSARTDPRAANTDPLFEVP